MSTPVRSTQLAANGSFGPTETLVYTAPANTRVIVKSIVMTNGNSSANRAYVVGGNGSVDLWSVVLELAAANASGESQQVQPWIVMNAGDTLKVGSAHNALSFVISGAVLSTA